jgi:hypothetical protein
MCEPQAIDSAAVLALQPVHSGRRYDSDVVQGVPRWPGWSRSTSSAAEAEQSIAPGPCLFRGIRVLSAVVWKRCSMNEKEATQLGSRRFPRPARARPA